jgi:hypothetical protein
MHRTLTGSIMCSLRRRLGVAPRSRSGVASAMLAPRASCKAEAYERTLDEMFHYPGSERETL